MQLPEMPLTQNGKIDKKRLPKVEYKPERGVYAAPANAVEVDFCGWFAELLSLDKVSADGNFFALGGTSLSAAIIAMNAADKGYPIVYADVFKAQNHTDMIFPLQHIKGAKKLILTTQDHMMDFPYKDGGNPGECSRIIG